MVNDRRLYNIAYGILLIVWGLYACFSWNLEWFERIARIVYVVSLCVFWYRNWKTHQKIVFTETMIVEKSNIKSSIVTIGIAILFTMLVLIKQFPYDHIIVIFTWIYSFLAVFMYRVPLILDEDRICIDGVWHMVKEVESVHIYKDSKHHDKVVFYVHERAKQTLVKHEFKEELKHFCEEKQISLFL